MNLFIHLNTDFARVTDFMFVGGIVSGGKVTVGYGTGALLVQGIG